MKRTTQLALQRGALLKAQHMAVINAVTLMSLAPPSAEFGRHGHITELNADLLTESTYREALTAYAVGFRQGNYLADLEALAPGVQVARRFDYKAWSNPEAFYSELTDDLRSTGADFKEVEYTKEEVTDKTVNRGLMVCVDLDQVKDNPNWENQYTGMLTTRLILNKLRRAINLISAGATNDAKTWDTTAGKDPDMDVITAIQTAHTAAGVRPNRVAYGPTAWTKRALSHRAQDTAGGFASASMTPEQLAGLLGVELVLRAEARYSTSATAKAEALSNLVLLYNALTGATVEDSSNVKGFWSPCDNGQQLMVHRWDMGPKKYCLAVEHYELTKLTSTLGLRKVTVS
jgi:hypothetical protein